MHASASPFEAMAERLNWLGVSLEDDAFGQVRVRGRGRGRVSPTAAPTPTLTRARTRTRTRTPTPTPSQAMPPRQLLKELRERGVPTAGLIESSELVDALRAARAAQAAADGYGQG